jgi:type IV pilus assembly protein PilW
MSACAFRRQQLRGLSLVELMVGLAVGMVVIAAGISAMAHQAAASRRVLLEARLTQELRAAGHLLSMHLRRAGHWSEAAQGVWRANLPPPPANPHTFTSEAQDRLHFTYSSPAAEPHGAVASRDHFGFRLRHGVLDIQLGEDHWQPLTDPGLLQITELRLVPRDHDRAVPAACGQPCAASASSCPPRVRMRELEIHIDATAVRDPGIRRHVTAHVRPRNDALVGQCEP